MRTSRSLLLLACCILVAAGLSACGTTNDNANSASTNTPTTPAQQNPGLVLSASPAKGPAAGGTIVTLRGEGFRGTPAVLFGSAEAREVTVVSETELRVVSPVGEKGSTVDITLRIPSAPTSTLVDAFRYE